MMETVVWITVFTMVMGAVTQTILYFYRTANYAVEQSSAIASAQRGIDTMVRVIRESSYSSNGAYPLIAIGTSSITFYANTDRATPLIQRVHFYLEGTNLKQGIATPSGDPPVYPNAESTSTVADFVRNIPNATTTFYYYDANGAQVTNYAQIANVRFITVNLVVDVIPATQPTQLTLRSSTALRNLVGR